MLVMFPVGCVLCPLTLIPTDQGMALCGAVAVLGLLLLLGRLSRGPKEHR